MAKPMATKAKASTPSSKKSSSSHVAKTTLNEFLNTEIHRLSSLHSIDPKSLEDFAYFVIEHHKKKDKKPKALTLAQLKAAIYQYFSVKNTTELKRSGSFKLATDGMDGLNLGVKDAWEKLYRKFVGIMPGEENQQGYGCINGIDIFAYFKPWQAFGLEAQAASAEDIKKAYRDLSKIYHPDVPNTGDAQIFDRLTHMYKSITAKA
jgi:DnaJ domain